VAASSPGLRDRLPHLDGLRAIAVMAVVICHAAKHTMDYHGNALFHPLFEGAHGVDLFFVISGFVLSYPSLLSWRDCGSTAFSASRFFANRVLRIFPPYWFAFAVILLTTIALTRLGFQAPWPTIKVPSVAYGLQQLVLWSHGNELCGSFWTLAVEFRWYLAFPLLLWLWTRSKIAFAGVGLASLLFYHFINREYMDFATLPAFMLGIVAAHWALKRSPGGVWAALLFILSVVAAVRFEPGHLEYALQNQILWQVACFFFVVAACTNSWLRRALSNRFLVLVGTASYSIYLFHDPIMAWYGKYGGANPGAVAPIAAAAAGMLVGLLAWLMFERWFMASRFRQTLSVALRHLFEVRLWHRPIALLPPIAAEAPIKP
jgi:peptidoglycan/LPS O-acetylase OafA/YrhL